MHGLFMASLTGDGRAYHLFLSKLSMHLRAFVRRRLTHLPDEIEDLVQETLLAVHNQRHTYDASQPLTSWIHAIAKYKLIDFLRRRAGREALNDPLDDASDFLASTNTEAAEAHRDIEKLLACLPEKQRLSIMLVKIEGLSVMETANRTGMSESAIKIGIHRGLKSLSLIIGGGK